MAQSGVYPKFRADDRDGNPLSGGRLYSFLSGTSTPAALYADPELTQPLPQPVILDASGEALFYYNGAAYGLTLCDADDVEQWTIDPVVGGLGGATGVMGLGIGANTVLLRPTAGTVQAAATIFPPDVLAMAVTVTVSETLGSSQGLEHVGLGYPDHPDAWGLLETLTASRDSTAGWFLAYGSVPQPQSGQVTLTAYGGRFDGSGAVYVTGHFFHFTPGDAVGYRYLPGTPQAGQILPPQPYATETTPGLIELLDATEVLQDTDLTRAVTIGRLVSRTSTETRLGLTRYGTGADTTAGTLTTVATHPAGVKAALDARLSGTPLRLPRYGASGTALESSALTSDPTTGNLGLRTTTPEAGLHLASDGVAQSDVQVDSYRDSSTGVALRGRRGRGTLATPARLQVADILTVLEAHGYVRNAGDSADALTSLGILRFAIESLDAQGRAGANLNFFLSPGASAGVTMRLRLTQAANLILGTTTLPGTDATATLALGPGVAPSTSPVDLVQLTAVDRGGTANKRSLHVRTEDGTSHVLGDLSGIGTTLSATLGSGASYQALNVKGSTLYVAQSSVQERAVGAVTATLPVSTDATRTGRLTVSAYDATAAREGLRVEADGSAARLGFFGQNAVVRQTVNAAATDATTTQNLVNSLRTALVNLGLCI